MNWWISQFVLGFALSFWPAPLIGLWLLTQDAQPAERAVVPQQYGPPPAFDPGPPEQPPLEELTTPEPVPEPHPEPEPMDGRGPELVPEHGRPMSPTPKPRPMDNRPPL